MILLMIGTYKATETEDIYNNISSKRAFRRCPKQIWKVAQRKLDFLANATQLEDLRVPPNNKLERLSGDREGQYSIRINQQYRICFRWQQDTAYDVEICDYH